ncbi:Dse3p NDAI_0E00990 [Naumovozyma dairenensis CBS 421]|uniref:Uncharacterized protein n=1 Tax=Naumovozyma dairenensis (strain ATCC 10597 / BCRC 20456 / CBS 421 / NBRC 0211 / NRRL Y-12639) TaxID=1071378 RepID=G0WAZ5_NAUDC|nr:hypothetical protein NDAI_0E00990 [Naumovozyma dairenensis CBS 421]CCD24915.1 hypothetical protein NDAI_0E00990 [Naumovozyma dairenensis CBS 421]
MPRKFLGERIEKGVDVIRPSSLTLTAEDIANLPIFQTSPFLEDVQDDIIFHQPNKGKRLSRRFGGTMKIKQRLESVPELFLHDFNKRQKGKQPINTTTIVSSDPKISYNNKYEENPRIRTANVRNITAPTYIKRKETIKRRIKPSTKEPTKTKLPLITVEEKEELSNEIYYEEKVRLKDPLELPVPILPNSNQNIHAYPITAGPVAPNLNHHIPISEKNGKSESEILFEEILDAYGSTADDNYLLTTNKGNNNNNNNNNKNPSTNFLLENEIDRILNHVIKKNNKSKMEKMNGLTTPKIIQSEFQGDIDFLDFSKTPIIESISSSPLKDMISSPEYTGTSEQWSSDDDEDEGQERKSYTFSNSNTSDEGYCTAKESLSSIYSVEDLEIKSIPKSNFKPTISRSLNFPQMKNQIVKSNVHFTYVKPLLFKLEDDTESSLSDEETSLLTRNDNDQKINASLKCLEKCQPCLSSETATERDSLKILQKQIENIDIISMTSSVYSEI